MKNARRLLVILLALGFATRVQAQVAIAPTVLVLGDRRPYTTLIVLNSSADSQEVSIDFRFGYPAGDSVGGVHMLYGDTLPSAEHSLQKSVRAFPKQFKLAPQQQQIVRVTASVPANAPPGTYWTRVVTSSGALTPPPTASASGQISARINFRLEQVTTLLYRHGSVNTGLAASGERIVQQPAPGVMVALSLTGNSPFLGGAHVRVRDAQGHVVGEEVEYFATYVDMLKRFPLPAAIKPGKYTCELEIDAERPDLSPDQLLRMPSLVRQFACTIP